MEPITTTALLDGATGYAAALMLNKIIDYIVPIKWQPQYKIQKERDERLEEYQKRQQRENQMFQIARDVRLQEFQMQQQANNHEFQKEENERNREFQKRLHRENQFFQLARDAQQIALQRQRDVEQRQFQMEMEANRMAFQERIEMRRLQVQCNLEKERARLTKSLNEQNIKNSKEIAYFNSRAMRETQILVARENAQNLLQDHLVQDALRNFPLNISPLVLLKNRPHSLSSLLRFTVARNDKELAKCNMQDVVNDVMSYAENPEALNVFVAPVYVDSKIKNREILSKQIWDTTYQNLESFFTAHYNRRSARPVIFYPTAWNDKYSPGMHASETLHFFLRDMPCIVLEPRFDGDNFRIMVSLWGLGYSSTEHIRTELNFQINIDTILAYSVYERSKISLVVLKDLLASDITDKEKRPFEDEKIILERNIKLYESLRIEERVKNDKMAEIDAFGIYKIFKILPEQDLKLLSKLLSDYIGMTLATLTDIHHLRSTDADPIYPRKMASVFPELYKNRELRERIFEIYKNIFLRIKEEEARLLPPEERGFIESRRILQLNEIETCLGIQDEESSKSNIEAIIKDYVEKRFGYNDPEFEKVWIFFIHKIGEQDIPFADNVLNQIKDDRKIKNLKKKIAELKRLC